MHIAIIIIIPAELAVILLLLLLLSMQERSARYLPQTEGETCQYKEFEVTLEEQCEFRDYVSSIVQLKSSESDAPHRVRHYRITCWPLSGLPSSTEKIITLLR